MSSENDHFECRRSPAKSHEVSEGVIPKSSFPLPSQNLEGAGEVVMKLHVPKGTRPIGNNAKKMKKYFVKDTSEEFTIWWCIRSSKISE